MDIDDRIHGISSIIRIEASGLESQASGFFFQELSPEDPESKPGWRNVLRTWLVTNRHVVLPKREDKEIVPDSLTFHLRRREGEQVIWEPVTISRAELVARTRIHKQTEVDVATVDILDILTAKLRDGRDYLTWSSVSEEQFAGRNNIRVGVTDPAIVVGYPRGFYDTHNVFPIVKSGIIASRWGSDFNGKPYFLIDAKLFPGSSGSIVLSAPRELVVTEHGLVLSSGEKQFAFLGVFSGEPFLQQSPIDLGDILITRKEGFNLGIVWYARLIPEIAKGGVELQ